MKSRRVKNRFLSTVLFLLSVYFFYYHLFIPLRRTKQTIWLEERQEFIDQYTKLFSTKQSAESSVNKPRCVLPKINPFSKEAVQFSSKIDPPKCDEIKYGRVEGGYYLVDHMAGLQSVTISYILRGKDKNGETIFLQLLDRYSDAINDDFHIHFSKEVNVPQRNGVYRIKLEGEFFRASLRFMIKVHREYHAHVSEKSCRKALQPRSGGLPFNIAMLMIDSQSKANFERHVPRVYETLRNDPNTLIFEGHTIHGDGTVAQVIAFLTGMLESELPETRRKIEGSQNCDVIDLIFKDFHKAGFTTMYAEDDVKSGTFHYRLNGFKDPPTDWWTRPYWIARRYKFGDFCDATDLLYLLKEFTNSCPNSLKFSVTMINSAHDDSNLLQTLERDLFDIIHFFKERPQVDNTILLLFADHGARAGDFRSTLQGKVEERLPFYSIVFPRKFREDYPDLFDTMKANTKVLTSHLDIYATLKHALSYPDRPQNIKYGQSLFTKINPEERGCNSTGVDDHWCPCLDFVTVPTDNEMVRRVTNEVINNINDRLNDVSNLCAKFRLKEILYAGKREPSDKVAKFKKVAANDKCDNCKVVYASNRATSSELIVEVGFRVTPGDATFEAYTKVSGDIITVDPSISRTNIYGTQSKCIFHTHPRIRQFCYCI